MWITPFQGEMRATSGPISAAAPMPRLMLPAAFRRDGGMKPPSQDP
jgi:hypothetical protein